MVNKIVFTSPEAMVELYMCKLYSFEYRSRYFFLTFRVMKFGRYVTVDDGGNLCHVSVDPSIY